MTSKLTEKELTNKFHRMMVKNLDITNSEISRFIDNTSLHLILTNLDQNKRMEFYKLLINNKLNSAEELVHANIPDFNSKLSNKIKDRFKDIL